jgi:hypothetical protein
MKSNYLTGTINSDLDLDDIFQKKESTSAVANKLGFLTADGTDLFDKYQLLKNNIYPLNTKYITKEGKDLTTLFEWGGYTPTVIYPATATINTAIISISGNCYKLNVTIVGAPQIIGFKHLNPYVISLTNFQSSTTYKFTIQAYNPLGALTQTFKGVAWHGRGGNDARKGKREC